MRCWPDSAKIGPNPVNAPNSADSGHTWPNSDRLRASSAELEPISIEILPNLADIGPNSAKFTAGIGRIQGEFRRHHPTIAWFLVAPLAHDPVWRHPSLERSGGLRGVASKRRASEAAVNSGGSSREVQLGGGGVTRRFDSGGPGQVVLEQKMLLFEPQSSNSGVAARSSHLLHRACPAHLWDQTLQCRWQVGVQRDRPVAPTFVEIGEWIAICPSNRQFRRKSVQPVERGATSPSLPFMAPGGG